MAKRSVFSSAITRKRSVFPGRRKRKEEEGEIGVTPEDQERRDVLDETERMAREASLRRAGVVQQRQVQRAETLGVPEPEEFRRVSEQPLPQRPTIPEEAIRRGKESFKRFKATTGAIREEPRAFGRGIIQGAMQAPRQIAELSAKPGRIAKEAVLEYPARFGGALALKERGEKEYTPRSRIEKFIMGDRTIKALGVEEKDMLESLGISPETAQRIGMPLAIGLGALDVLPIGKGAKRIPKGVEKLLNLAKKAKTADKFKDSIIRDAPILVRELDTLKKSKISADELFKMASEAPVKPLAKPIAKKPKEVSEIKPTKLVTKKPELPIEPKRAGQNLTPTVIKGDSFVLGEGKLIQPTTKELKDIQKIKIKATKQEVKNAEIAKKKAERLVIRQQKIRTEAMKNINRQRGNTNVIIKSLKKRNLSDEDISNIVLEDGTKLIDTVKVKRNPDKSLASVITKPQIDDLKRNYTGKSPERWVRKYSVARVGEKTGDLAQIYELPQVYFERKGLGNIYDTIINEGERAGEAMKTEFIKKFKKANLFKEGGWFTADRFKLSRKEADKIGKYYLSRQNKGYDVSIKNLSSKERKFVEIFDSVIKETEPRFYEVAKKSGKTPGKVEKYAPIMTKDDIVRIDQEAGTMDFITRKHPAFFSTKERAKKVPRDFYETDYRKVASRWLDGITKFNTTGDVAPDIKYLLDSEQFKGIINPKDYEIISEWFQKTLTPQIPRTKAGKSVNFVSRLLRKTSAMASLGLNYGSVVKQALTQIPLTIVAKAPPKFKSEFAKAFKISVKDLPSLTSRKGNIAIQDLQGSIGRIFTGPLTKFDKMNAQVSLNRLLDKEYGKYLKQSAKITPETQAIIQKKAQDTLDLWYGGMVSTGQRPEAFRSEVGKFINMFIYPLTSQLNGFYRHIYKAKGVKNFQSVAEVAVAATSIAYLEQVISNLSTKWSDEKEMTSDVLQSLLGNIPILGQLAWSFRMENDLQISPGITGISNLLRKTREISKGETGLDEGVLAFAEVMGLPKQVRRTKEGMEIINEGGIKDKKGKMLAPVKEVDEQMRAILRGKYGSMAAKDWIRNIGEKKENRRWFVPQVEFLQNGDYDRKAELYKQFTPEEQKELRSYLSEAQQKKLDKVFIGEKAENIWDEIGNIPTNEQDRKIDAIEDDKIFKAVASLQREKESGITRSEKELKNKSVKNRAKIIFEEFERRGRNKEYINDLIDKNVLTIAVENEIIDKYEDIF